MRQKRTNTAHKQPTEKTAAVIARVSQRRTVRDGAREVAMAVATLTNVVKVDLSQEPFSTDPDELFERKFSEVGIGDTQMPLLRQQLKQLLPEIAQELDENARVLDQSAHRIDDYAAFVRVALMLKLR